MKKRNQIKDMFLRKFHTGISFRDLDSKVNSEVQARFVKNGYPVLIKSIYGPVANRLRTNISESTED